MPNIIPSASADATNLTACDSLMTLLTHGGAESEVAAICAVADFRTQVERELRQQAVKDALLKLHDWDELIFGGFYCMHCTPDDPDSLDDPIAWPCPSLRAVGMTDEEAVQIITAHRAAIQAKATQGGAA